MPLQLAMLGQFAALVQFAFPHFLVQLVHVACLALAFLTGTLPLAIKDAPANNIATMHKLIFFI